MFGTCQQCIIAFKFASGDDNRDLCPITATCTFHTSIPPCFHVGVFGHHAHYLFVPLRSKYLRLCGDDGSCAWAAVLCSLQLFFLKPQFHPLSDHLRRSVVQLVLVLVNMWLVSIILC